MSAARPAVAVVGRGRWGGRLAAMLADEGHAVTSLGLRAEPGEQEADYTVRVSDTLREVAPDAALVWLAVPPTAPQAALIAGALRAGRHIVVEKPLWVDDLQADALAREAERRGLVAAVHFQYCYLEAWPDLAAEFDAEDAAFCGAFTTSGNDRLGVPAPDNLGSHLLAVRRRWFPATTLAELRTAYDATDLRQVVLRRAGAERRVDFTASREPIVQRFLRDLLTHAEAGRAFALDLAFAAGVRQDLAGLDRPGAGGAGARR